METLRVGLKRKLKWLQQLSVVLILLIMIVPLTWANPSAMIQALLGVGSPVTPASLINSPSGDYFNPYLNVTIDTSTGATYFKSKVGLSVSTDCSASTGYSAETLIADSTPLSLFASPTPSTTANDGDYELGMQFQTYFSGKITGVRYYRTAAETGSHTGRIWDSLGNLISSVNFTGESASGWQQATFSSPVSVEPEQDYTVSVNNNTDYPYQYYGFASSISNGQIFSVVSVKNGSYNPTVGSFPNQYFNQSNYYRDVVFTRTSHVVDDLSSLTGQNLKLCVVARDAVGNWQGYSSATQATWYQAKLLLGSQIKYDDDYNVDKQAEAIQFTAVNSGTVNKVRVFIRTGSAATKLIAGIYDESGGAAQNLLASGSINSPVENAWNTVTLGSSVSITSGTKYWIAILGNGGQMNFYSTSGGIPSSACTSFSTNLTALPSSWTSGTCYDSSPAALFAY